MGYCTVADIQAEFKTISFSSTSLVTDATVQTFITEASAVIDSKVGQRWVTPITADATSLALMSIYCRVLVSARVKGILENKQTTNVDANQNVKVFGMSASDVMKALEQIRNGETQLSGATLALANAAFYSNNNQNNVQPVFHKNTKQW